MLMFKIADTKPNHGWCVVIRTMVFEAEQKVPVDLEIDEFEDESRHILGFDDGKPCAAARWRRYKPAGTNKIERVAVLKEWRGKKVGQALMEAVIADILAFDPACKTLRLEAQDYAIPFYEKLGFRVVGDGFMDGGIPHHAMEKAVNQ